MRLIRRLADLERNGSELEQRFAVLFVASRINGNPNGASGPELRVAWKEAQKEWEEAVEDIAREADGYDIPAAEEHARLLLTRVALARLRRYGWKPLS